MSNPKDCVVTDTQSRIDHLIVDLRAAASLGRAITVDEVDDIEKRLSAALAEARAASTGEWVTVPREPTPEMIKAAEQQWLVGSTNDMARREWHAMLAASPPAPTVSAEPVAWADPQAFKNFKERGHLGGAHAREWMWAKPDIGLVPLYTAPPPVEASQQQAEGDCTWEHAANEWADVATNAVTVLENVRDGITSFEDAIASFKSWYESARASQPGAEKQAEPAGGEMAELDGNETNPIVLWTEIERLRADVRGPQGYQTWQSAATDERMRRVKAERELSRLTAELSAAKAEAEALRKDAERYLWMRDTQDSDALSDIRHCRMRKDWDVAIDAAIAAQQGKGGEG